jgi:hypothetical protein
VIALRQVSRDTHSEFRRHHSFCCEGRALQKKSTNYFLQNEANLAELAEMHDDASYHTVLQVMKCNKERRLNNI